MITRWPAERLRSFDRFSQMMEDVFAGSAEGWTPLVDVKETPKDLKFVVELPGMLEKDVHVELSENVLTISGARELREEENKDEYIRIERSYGTFQRSFTINSAVKPEAIRATFKDGLLTVLVPKAENRPSHKIPVKAV